MSRAELVALLADAGRRHVSIAGHVNVGVPFAGEYADAELARLWTLHQRPAA